MAHPDLDRLLSAVIPFAQDMLAKHKGFLPFGASMTSEGSLSMVAGHAGAEEAPAPRVIDLIFRGLRGRAETGDIRAAVICYDVKYRTNEYAPKADAICASLSHSNGESVNVLLPYRARFLGGLHYGETFAEPGTLDVFGGGSN